MLSWFFCLFSLNSNGNSNGDSIEVKRFKQVHHFHPMRWIIFIFIWLNTQTLVLFCCVLWFVSIAKEEKNHSDINSDAILICLMCSFAYNGIEAAVNFSNVTFSHARFLKCSAHNLLPINQGFILCSQTSRSYLYGSILLVFFKLRA